MRAVIYISVCVVFCLVLAAMFFRRKPKIKAKAVTLVKIRQRNYAKENEVAGLLMKVAELKHASPTWPVLLGALNPGD